MHLSCRLVLISDLTNLSVSFNTRYYLNGNSGIWSMPIDPDFQKKLKVTGEHEGHKVWGETNLPTKRGIHGTNTAVDQDICNGDEICVSVCPVSVYQMINTPGHPTSAKKSDPVNESACIQCMACEIQCPTKAIKITPP